MNERIQELAYQAEEYADTMVDGGSEFHPVFVKKLAELLVGECADIAKHHVMNISTYADAEFVEQQIKQNFGVKQ